ncbi:STAS domain-containing protein [Amycolatopsis azurea]|uniref:Putative sulfate-transport transmembrane protein ABC transporter n=1 Tax=Amycolatopsis azurea DSM 43854 TaxID=1238180 RepID=M2QBL1_9PSEU|nr:sodium-independent anion transporter [Amycolatopsis azurea]EMD24141.1 putative sulfate-transport transmembrane protein ABC transporter [Amycolatopsis azurea DSM 43854]
MTELPREIIEHYRSIDEGARLTGAVGRLEFLRTQEIVRRHLPAGSLRVLDIGGATGVHAAWLAADGHRVALFDIVDDFRRRTLGAALAAGEQVEWFVLYTEANVEIDITAADALREICVELRRHGITFALARVKQELREDLAAAGLLELMGAGYLYPTLPSVVEAFRRRGKSGTGKERKSGMNDVQSTPAVLEQDQEEPS